MKLRFYLGLFFISFLKIAVAQEPVILGGVVSVSYDGDDIYIINTDDDHELPNHVAYKFNTELLELEQCINLNTYHKIEKLGKVEDSTVLIGRHSFGPFRYYNFLSEECEGDLNLLPQDTFESTPIQWVILGNVFIGKPTNKPELLFFDRLGENRAIKIIDGDFENNTRNYFGVSSDSNLIYIDLLKKFIHKIDTSGNVLSSREIPIQNITSLNLRKGAFNVLNKSIYPYEAIRVNEDGTVLKSAVLRDTCINCEYEGVLITNEAYFLFGSLFQKEEYFLSGPSIDRDPVISKFDNDGNLISSKMYDDDVNSKFKFGFKNSQDELMIFGDFDDRNAAGRKYISPNGGYISSTTELSNFDKLEYQPLIVDTMVIDTMVIDTMITDTMKTDSITNDIDQFKIGPNPVDDKFIIHVPEKDVEYELNFYGIHGRRIENLKFIDQVEVEVALLEHGVYIYQVINLSSGKVHTGKILVYH